MKATILVVDEAAPARRVLAAELRRAGFGVIEAEDGETAWARFEEAEPDAVVAELQLPRCDGPELLERIRGRSTAPVIFKSAEASVAEAVRVIKAGASEFVAGSDPRAGELPRLVADLAAARAAGPAPSRHATAACDEASASPEAGEPDAAPRPDDASPAAAEVAARLAGRGPHMRRVRARLLGLAPLETPVLVVGEAGTGRDAAVAALHAVGSSARGSLRRIDCARFDVRAGVPTCSAVYLDGLEALTPAMQAYWGQQLREFARRRFRGVPRVLASASPDFGRPGPGPADPRLGDALMRFALTLPPLRERPEDVPDIADALVARLAEGMGRQARLTGAAHAFLREQRWHGNIRQLERLLERAVAFGGGGPIDREALGELMRDDESSVESIRGASALRERHALLEALEHRGGNISQTSIDLGKSRGAVYRLIEKYGIPLRDRR